MATRVAELPADKVRPLSPHKLQLLQPLSFQRYQVWRASERKLPATHMHGPIQLLVFGFSSGPAQATRRHQFLNFK